MDRSRRMLVVIALALACADVRSAHACLCSDYVAVPARDAVEVPTNLRDLVLFSSGPSFSSSMLVDDRGVAIPLGAPVSMWGYTMWQIPVLAELESNRSYLWGYQYGFRTAAGRDDEPPGPIHVELLEIDRVDTRSNVACPQPELDIRADVRLPPDAATMRVRFSDGEDVQERIVTNIQQINTGICGARMELAGTYRVDLWARDLAGNEGPMTTTHVTVTKQGCVNCSSNSAPSAWVLVVAVVLRQRRRRSDRCRGGRLAPRWMQLAPRRNKLP